jgi:hypothetical protein
MTVKNSFRQARFGRILDHGYEAARLSQRKQNPRFSSTYGMTLFVAEDLPKR